VRFSRWWLFWSIPTRLRYVSPRKYHVQLRGLSQLNAMPDTCFARTSLYNKITVISVAYFSKSFYYHKFRILRYLFLYFPSSSSYRSDVCIIYGRKYGNADIIWSVVSWWSLQVSWKSISSEVIRKNTYRDIKTLHTVPFLFPICRQNYYSKYWCQPCFF
jgi:hypothetical protein